MTTTPHLALPLLAAAQAQKHVTHNEALASLDALVHLAVKERNRTAAPAAPAEGERYLIGAGATGSFAGHDGEIALFDLGIWRFFPPRAGWRAYVEAEDRIVVFDGSVWHDLGHYNRDLDNLQRLGVGTQADDLNRLSAKLNAALFSAVTEEEGGSGDLRFVLNKDGMTNVLSQLYQQGFSGRAETGLIGSDNYSIRVSSDGSQWRDAIHVESGTGVVSFPSGLSNLPRTNLLINPAFLVNQRGFAGGSLIEGAYGYDRWRAATGGCTVSRTADGVVTLVGSLEQVIDVAQASSLTGRANLAGLTLTLSAEDPTGPLPVMIGTRRATIAAGSGRRSVTVSLDPSETGNVTVRLQPVSPCSFRRLKLEIGSYATPYVGEPIDIEEFRCRRYYQRLAASGGSPGMLIGFGQRVAGNCIDVPCLLPVTMRANPSYTTSGLVANWANGAPTGGQIGFYIPGEAAWAMLTGNLSIITPVPSTPSSIVLRFQAGTSFSGAPGAIGNLFMGSSAFIAVQAEL